jgi:hypothetical protein
MQKKSARFFMSEVVAWAEFICVCRDGGAGFFCVDAKKVLF